ncbi:hypothetical protein JTE90_019921 [Oedothorax gibbosus]|uniref:SANT domain-containing protein n=1 Tax=Oedothorax gibbosus TaxID=931172 RepID=A0AAV6UQX3_9ARAC|nr:hypothetical protein JTE90_019921 [Oedothorax gibbosus]
MKASIFVSKALKCLLEDLQKVTICTLLNRMPGEGEDAVDNDIESNIQQTSSAKRPLSSRGASKDALVKSPEILEADSAPGCVEKTSHQRCSNRITKRLRRDPSPLDPVSKKSAPVKQPTEPSTSSKTRRPWELWSVEDKNAFFEALCEYGKDFESIQSHIAQRSKKKGVATNMIKNKDQVRHFYYRTWHKISKYLKVTESVGKQTQELYGLINYSELRKKIGGCLNEKNGQKLNELVLCGVTTVKLKGKRLRIKTPVCRALKKLNNVADTKEPETEKLPKEICVEFRPHTNTAWLHVQSLAQNPRVRTKVNLQKRLSSVIEFFQNRWKPYRLKRKEQILSSLPDSVTEGVPCDTSLILRVKPASDAKICPLSLSVMDVASSSDLCLQKYMKLSPKVLCQDISKAKKPLCLNQKIQDDKQYDLSESPMETDQQNFSSDIISDCNDKLSQFELKEMRLQSENQSICESMNLLEGLSLSKTFSETDMSHNNDIDNSVFDALLSGESSLDSSFSKSLEECYKKSYLMIGHDPQENIHNLMNSSETEVNFELQSTASESLASSFKSLLGSDKNNLPDLLYDSKEDEEENNCDSIFYKTVRDGWTVEEAGFLTFGELYLLLGKPPTIVLEYEFEASTNLEDYPEMHDVSTKKSILKKVLEVAQNYYMDTKNKQVLAKHRSSTKSAKIKLCNQTEKVSKEASIMPSNAINESEVTIKEGNCSKSIDLPKTSTNISDNATTSTDKHVFAVPTAPRNVKPPDQNTLKEEIGKLLPGTRRGCRVRRKPLVVQRPLLPREGMARPLTFVHIVPTVSSMSNAIPTNTRTETKMNLPSSKSLINLLPPGMPIQVPFKQVRAAPGQKLVLVKTNTIPGSQVAANQTSGNLMQIITDPTASCSNSTVSRAKNSPNPPENKIPVVDLGSQSFNSSLELSSPTNLDMLNLDLLSESQSNALVPEDTFGTMQPMSSILDISNSSTFANITPSDETSFLEELGFSIKNKDYDQTSGPVCFGETHPSSLKQNTPPSSPLNLFKVTTPDIQWMLNGESPDMNLNTFLNSLESPTKPASATSPTSLESPIINNDLSLNTFLDAMETETSTKLSSASTSSLSMENSNFDPMGRLAPVVDAQVRCMLDECSLDFIAKFEDLADVISDDSKHT